MAPLSVAATTTNETASAAGKASNAAGQFDSHFERLEARMDRIEIALNNILEHLRLPKIDSASGIKQDGEKWTGERSARASVTMQRSDQDVTVEQDANRQYMYTPLDTTKSQFRILRVRRAEELSDPLVTELVTLGLDDNTVARLMYGFTALSYTWGPPVFDGCVSLDGCKFPITKSLEAALRQLRFEYKDNAAIEINRLGPGGVHLGRSDL